MRMSENASQASEPRAARIMGIDPGSQRTGVGIVDVDARGRISHVHHETLSVAAGEASFPLRLKRIFEGLCAIMEAYVPAETAVERVFMSRNADSALKLGQARGAAICAAVVRGIQVHEYSPSEIKQSVVGSGRADKTQVQHMVAAMLGLQGPLQADAADALAMAITHAHCRNTMARVGIPRSAWRRRR